MVRRYPPSGDSFKFFATASFPEPQVGGETLPSLPRRSHVSSSENNHARASSIVLNTSTLTGPWFIKV